MRLTDQNYWENTYKDAALPQSNTRFKRILRQFVGPRLFDLLSPYDDYLLWRVVLPQYLPKSCTGLSAIEIGSAPGNFLVRFAKTFGGTPYGVEYTRHGADCNRNNFAANGLDPNNVIEDDFFSEQFLDAYRGRFDIVFSRGFIEHFADPEAVVSRHVALLKPGGLLVITIPQLHGIYSYWTRAFNPELLPMHNLDIMKLQQFQRLFDSQSLDILRCSYFGTFSFWLFTAHKDAWWASHVIRGLIVLQRLLNLVFRLAFREHGYETAMFSPNLIFVGRKKRATE